MSKNTIKMRLSEKEACKMGSGRFLLVLVTVVLTSPFCIYRNVLASEMYKPVTITDATGQSLTFNRSPRRIVVMGAAPFVPLHMLYMFPETKKILVGYEQKTTSMDSFLELIDTDYKNKSALMTNPGIEQITALKPDLVVAKGTTSGVIDRPLSELGIPILYVNAENPEAFLNDIDIIGKVLGNEKRTKEISAYYSEKLNLIKKGLEGIGQDQKPRALVLEYSNRGGGVAVRVPAQSWIQTIQVQEAGGLPVWLDQVKLQYGWQIVGFEQIARWNPDLIFMVVWYTLNPQQVMESLRSDSKWRLLNAVATNHFYLIPQDIFSWDTPDPRWILGMLWMATKMHPERFSHLDIIDEVYLFFETLYGMDKKEVELHILPKLVLNTEP